MREDQEVQIRVIGRKEKPGLMTLLLEAMCTQSPRDPLENCMEQARNHPFREGKSYYSLTTPFPIVSRLTERN